MASQRMIFLVALLLSVALGCHGGRICHSNKDCPTCKVGVPLCGDGVCTCVDMKTNDKVAHQKQIGRCKVDNDCAKLCNPNCRSYNCVNHLCLCTACQ